MKGKEKPLLEKYKVFWENGKSIFQTDKKIGFCLQNYAVNQIFSGFKSNSKALNESHKKEFEQMIKDLAVEKKSIGEDANCTAEEFVSFLENMFANVDDEDRNGEVTMKTSYSFRMLSELIDVLLQWGPIPEEWQKKSKIIIILFF
jgi:hypothetical protein